MNNFIFLSHTHLVLSCLIVSIRGGVDGRLPPALPQSVPVTKFPTYLPAESIYDTNKYK
jgi:hypothetical protein